MKTLITILFLSLLSSPSWSDPFSPIDESMELGELVKREGIYYKKFLALKAHIITVLMLIYISLLYKLFQQKEKTIVFNLFI